MPVQVTKPPRIVPSSDMKVSCSPAVVFKLAVLTSHFKCALIDFERPKKTFRSSKIESGNLESLIFHIKER